MPETGLAWIWTLWGCSSIDGHWMHLGVFHTWEDANVEHKRLAASTMLTDYKILPTGDSRPENKIIPEPEPDCGTDRHLWEYIDDGLRCANCHRTVDQVTDAIIRRRVVTSGTTEMC